MSSKNNEHPTQTLETTPKKNVQNGQVFVFSPLRAWLVLMKIDLFFYRGLRYVLSGSGCITKACCSLDTTVRAGKPEALNIANLTATLRLPHIPPNQAC